MSFDRHLVNGEECKMKLRVKSSLTRKHATKGIECVSSVYKAADSSSKCFLYQSDEEAIKVHNADADTVEGTSQDQDEFLNNEQVCDNDFDIFDQTEQVIVIIGFPIS